MTDDIVESQEPQIGEGLAKTTAVDETIGQTNEVPYDRHEETKRLNAQTTDLVVGLHNLRGSGVKNEDEEERFLKELQARGADSEWYSQNPTHQDTRALIEMLANSYPWLKNFSAVQVPQGQPRDKYVAEFANLVQGMQREANSEISIFEGIIRYDQGPTAYNEAEEIFNSSAVVVLNKTRNRIQREFSSKATGLRDRREWNQIISNLGLGLAESVANKI